MVNNKEQTTFFPLPTSANRYFVDIPCLGPVSYMEACFVTKKGNRDVSGDCSFVIQHDTSGHAVCAAGAATGAPTAGPTSAPGTNVSNLIRRWFQNMVDLKKNETSSNTEYCSRRTAQPMETRVDLPEIRLTLLDYKKRPVVSVPTNPNLEAEIMLVSKKPPALTTPGPTTAPTTLPPTETPTTRVPTVAPTANATIASNATPPGPTATPPATRRLLEDEVGWRLVRDKGGGAQDHGSNPFIAQDHGSDMQSQPERLHQEYEDDGDNRMTRRRWAGATDATAGEAGSKVTNFTLEALGGDKNPMMAGVATKISLGATVNPLGIVVLTDPRLGARLLACMRAFVRACMRTFVQQVIIC